MDAVSKRYPGQRKDQYALDAVSLAVAPGEIYGIVGRSGAGKSTLIRTINRLEPVDSGTIRVSGIDVGALSRAQLLATRRRIGMIFQHFNLLSAKTVRDNIALPLVAAGVARPAIEARVTDVLDLVGLADKRDTYPSRLSGGQKQRVGIARALVQSPDVLLCDEATSALDPETTVSILDLLRDINRRLGLTIMLITHELDVVREICDRVAVLENGRIVEQGDVCSVFGAPRHASTQALLGSQNERLPQSLRQSLAASPPDTAYHVALDIRYQDVAFGSLPIGELLGALGKNVRLLHAHTDDIKGRLFARFIVDVPATEFDTPDFQSRLHDIALSPRVLGYVKSSA